MLIFLATTWWIWLIVTIVFGAITGISMFRLCSDKPALYPALYFVSLIFSIIVFFLSSVFFVIGLIAAFIGYAKS